MPKKTLHDAFVDELRDTYDAEKQIVKALPKIAKAATAPKLRAAFERHLEETKGQITRLEEAFVLLDQKLRGKHCDGMAGILAEGKAAMAEAFDDATMDACLIASAQRVEHYEMAAYGTLIAWGKVLGLKPVVTLLERTLKQENDTDKALTSLADGGINHAAAGMGEDSEG